MRSVGFRPFVELVLVRSYWLGLIEDKRPELCPGFFEVDLAPRILRRLRPVLTFLTFLWRNDDGECCGYIDGSRRALTAYSAQFHSGLHRPCLFSSSRKPCCC